MSSRLGVAPDILICSAAVQKGVQEGAQEGVQEGVQEGAQEGIQVVTYYILPHILSIF